MKSKDLFDAIGMAKDEYISDAKKPTSKKKLFRSKGFYSGLAALLACAILIGAFAFPKSPWFVGGWFGEEEEYPLMDDDLLSRYRIGEVFYPSMVQYPQGPNASSEDRQAWRDCISELNSDYRSMSISLDHFLSQSIPVFLSEKQGENMVYSPLNVYMALGMLAETTNGNSRAQVLDLLGVASVNQLRREAAAIWKANYRDDGMTTCLLANSLWLREDWDYRGDTVAILSRDYYASVFRGEMGSDGYNEALQAWMNEQTGGLLKDQIDNLKMTPDTVLALVSTVWFEASWDNKFYGSEDRVFHAPTGDIETVFMTKSDGMTYSWGEKFGAVDIPFKNPEHGRMTVILPDEGVSAESLLSDTQWIDFVINRNEWENEEAVTVNLSLPKFDVSSQIDLQEGLKALGVTDIFDYTISDFSAITTESDEIYVDKATHGARVQIDEEGCIAAAYTFIEPGDGALPPEKEIGFVVDRPFLFVIYSPSNLPLFVGIVNQPQ